MRFTGGNASTGNVVRCASRFSDILLIWTAALAMALCLLACAVPASGQAEAQPEDRDAEQSVGEYAEVAVEKHDLPLNVLTDDADFTFYLNEEVLVTGHCSWLDDGTFSSRYRLSMAGQFVDTELEIDVDEDGHWVEMNMVTPQGPVTITRQGTKAVIDDGRGHDDTVELLPNTVLFENFSPLLMSQMVSVSEGYKRELDIVGIGYKAEVKGKELHVSVGYASPKVFPIPEGLKIKVEGGNRIFLESADKWLIGQSAATIRKIRPPEPYKGKGIRYSDEQIKRKVGKAAVGAGG